MSLSLRLLHRPAALGALLALWLLALPSGGHPLDTVRVSSRQLNPQALILGPHTYIVYNKKTKDSPSVRIMLVRITIAQEEQNHQSVIAIKQRWELDTVVHTATTLLRRADFSTLLHETYWRPLGYTARFDFDRKEISYKGPVADSVKQKNLRDFQQSFGEYNLNWHSDLVIFSLLPYKDKTTFVLNFYDPGAGAARHESYTVMGSETLTNHQGQPVACWLLQYAPKDHPGYYQKFWIDKRTKEVLKEEDLFNGHYRYKLKVSVSE